MKKAVCVLLLFLIWLAVARCGGRAAPPEPAPTDTVVEAAEPTAVPAEPTAVPPTPTPEPPTPTNTLVVPVMPTDTPAAEPTGAPMVPPLETHTPQLPTAVVGPELVELLEWAEGLEEELLQPIEDMAATLEELMPESGLPDIRTFCTGVELVLATLTEVQGGLDGLGPPPIEDADLQECWYELSAAIEDFYQGLLLLDSFCDTVSLADLRAAAAPLESGAQHLENASEAFERWQSRTGF